MSINIIIINGPNLNLLGEREQSQYGSITFQKLKENCLAKAKELNIHLEFTQSNIEGEIVNLVQAAKNKFDGIIINAAGFTHTSVAIRDSYNVSSVTDNTTGDYTISFVNNMANTNYAINLASANGAVRQFILAGNDTVGSYRVRTQSSSGGQSNASYVYSTVFGD